MGRDTFDIIVQGRRAHEVRAEVLDWMRSKRIRVMEDQGHYILFKKGGFWLAPTPIFFEIRFEEHLRGVKDVTLYFRVDSGPWTEYGVSANGDFLFGALSDGYHEFYSIATDNWGNVEDPPATADAYTYVDTLPPNLAAPSNIDNREDSTLEWQGEDETTGIDHYEVSVDRGAFENVGLNTSYQIGSLPEGTQITIRAYDKAGNFQEKTVRIVPEPAFLGVQNDMWLLILAIAAVIAVLAAIIVYRRRSERD